MSLSVTVLGSSGMFATTERACSGYLLEYGGRAVLLDAGAGAWRNLLPLCSYEDLAGVVLSHRHPDHTTDVFQLFHARHYGAPEHLAPIPLWAPAETIERIVDFAKETEDAFDLQPIADGDRVDVFGAAFRFFRMAHPPETLGCRVEHEGATFAYSADSGAAADFEGLAAGADVFVCEATLQDSDEPWEGHLSAAQAGELAAGLGAGDVVLTHLPPGRDAGLSLAEAARTAGGARIRLAADGLRLEVGS